MERVPVQVMYAILAAAVLAQPKNRLVFEARLASNQIRPYLALLLRSGLLKMNEEGTYHTTKKGRGFMQSYERLEMLARIPATEIMY